MRKALILLSLFALPIAAWTQEDTIQHKKSIFKKVADGVVGIVKEFNNIDTAYIEPQHYKFCTTLMSTYNFERYTIKSESGQEIKFSPEARVKIGPYIGWSLLFLGYTVDIAYISANKKKELDLSAYTSMIGFDFFRRVSGSDYLIRAWNLGEGTYDGPYTSIPYDGLEVSITGLNAYYITNHRKFSYPAAFTQSTCQRKSAGSFMFGAGYTRHALKLDYQKLKDAFNTVEENLGEKVDSNLYFNNIKYTDVQLSAGYGYNWVFSRNWLLSVSLSAALGYKKSKGEHDPSFLLDDFSFHNFNFDGVGRFGIIWNNSKWYFGAYGVAHSYNYKKSKFETSNFFGNINVYIGVNFGRKKSHKVNNDTNQ